MPCFTVMRTLLLFLAMLSCAGCMARKVNTKPDPPVILPASFSTPGSAQVIPDRWWTSFDDAALERTISRVLAANLSLKTAWSRMEQFRAIARREGSALWPSIDIDASSSRSRSNPSSTNSRLLRTYSSNHSLALSPSYEVDLWAGIRSARNAAEYEATASEKTVHALAISLTAQAAKLWYEIAEINAQTKLLADQYETSRTFQELVLLRFSNGLATSVDLLQQKQQVASVEARAPGLNARLRLAMNELAVLMGQAPTEIPMLAHASLPELAGIPSTGVPADLLERRPDVRASLYQAVAAEFSLIEAEAERYPVLRLSGSLGFSSGKTSTLFDNWIGSITSALSAPIFDAGRIAANIRQVRASAKESYYEYGIVVLNALREVEDAVVQETGSRDELAKIEERISIAESNLEQARNRFMNGQSDFLPVLNALQTLQELESSRLSSKLAFVRHRISLLQALGGAWPRDLNHDSEAVDLAFEAYAADQIAVGDRS